MRGMGRRLLLVVSLAAALVYLNNASFMVSRPAQSPTLLAHRGIAQRYDTDNLRNDTCTAARMLPPTHEFLENTIASMRASFEAGADVVELDIHPTTDGRFAVFHDWTLDCRTDGTGVTRAHSMAALKKLDIGYGYTADGSRTFPFRGKGIGLMPSLDEVFATFPDRRFLINIKSRDPEEGAMLAARLKGLSATRRARLMVLGADAPVAALRRALPDMKTASPGSLRNCLVLYLARGWTGLVPEACHDRVVLVPINVAPWLWGWPDRFLNRMEAAGSVVFLLGPYRGGEFSTGIDTSEDIARIPPGYSGGVWTNEIERIAKALKPGVR